MKILDLLKKYESNESIEYLRNVFGSDDYINDIFTDTMGLQYIIENRNLDYKVYKIFHNIYIHIKDDLTIDNTILNCLITLESYYTIYSKSSSELDEIKKTSKRFIADELRFRLVNKTMNMYNINNIPNDYIYYILAKKINSEIKDFSLSVIFNSDTTFDKKHGFNGTSLITRIQNVSRINEPKFNNMKGSGYHDTNFAEILKVVYGISVNNNTSGQDIKVRYSKFMRNDGALTFNMLLEIPLVISSFQKKSLEYLNNEIKQLEYDLNTEICVNCSIMDYEYQSYTKYYNNQSNLDNALDSIIVNDYTNDKYKEICFIGYSNLENHYNRNIYIRKS